jgi:hypothetical protein
VSSSRSPLPVTCETRRFDPGATVRLRATGLSGFAPAWTGCDDVGGDTWTVATAGARVVGVVPQ